MPEPNLGDVDVDLMDEQLRWMNHAIWATDEDGEVDDLRRRTCWARYYGELSYIDAQLGRLLDAVEARDDAENTIICYFSDHGEHLGDHRAWQKESFFEEAARVPFLLSWPAEIPKRVQLSELICLTDLFGVATRAAGEPEFRDGIDLLGMLRDESKPRQRLVGYYGAPGSRRFKVMVREADWKYIFMANGGREQLFDLATDPSERHDCLTEHREVATRLRNHVAGIVAKEGLEGALDGEELCEYSFEERDRNRITQFNHPIDGFPENPADVLEDWQ